MMSHDASDHELLDRFAAGKDQSALAEIVRRYIGMVTASARRQVRDPHLAADIAQAVFIVLVRKAATLRTDTNLSAWLFTVTRHAVANARRVQTRRQIHETQMASITCERSSPSADVNAEVADEIRSVLDDGIAKLSQVERTSVLMHYFGQKSHREVGAAIGVNEEAARKRVARSIDKLRTILVHRRGGATLTPSAATTTTSAALASVMIAEGAEGAAIAAQSSLVASTASVAMIANTLSGAGGTSLAALIAQGVMRTLRASRTKLAAAACIAALLLIGVTTILAYSKRNPTVISRPVQPTLALHVGQLMKVEFLGASTYPPDANSWFAADGAPIALPDERLLGVNLPIAVPPQFQAAVRVEKPTSHAMRLHVPGSSAGSNMIIHDGGDAIIVVAVFSFMTPSDRTRLELAIADGSWTTIATNENPQIASSSGNAVTFDSIAPADGGSTVSVRHGRFDGQHQVVAIDCDGVEHVATELAVTMLRANLVSKCRFDVPSDQVARIVLQTRAFGRFIDFDQISLGSNYVTQPTIRLRK